MVFVSRFSGGDASDNDRLRAATRRSVIANRVPSAVASSYTGNRFNVNAGIDVVMLGGVPMNLQFHRQTIGTTEVGFQIAVVQADAVP